MMTLRQLSSSRQFPANKKFTSLGWLAVVPVTTILIISNASSQTIQPTSTNPLCMELKSKPSAWQCRFEEPNTVGNLWENTFSNMLPACNVSLLAKNRGFPSRQAQLSAIPKELQDSPYLSKKLWYTPTITTGFSVEKMFSSIFNSDKITPNSLKNLNVFNDEFSATNPGAFFEPLTGKVALAADCTQILSMALGSNANFTLPGNDFELIFKDQISKSNKLSTAVSAGQFISPYRDSFSSPGGAPSQFFPLMKLWDWYAKNLKSTQDLNISRYVIDSFRGSTVLQYQEAKDIRTISGTASYILGIPGISGSITSGTSIQGTLNFEAKSFQVGIMAEDGSENPDLEMKRIPNIYQTVKALEAYAPILIPGFEKNISSIGPVPPHVQTLVNLPKSDCYKTKFKIERTKGAEATYEISKQPKFSIQTDDKGENPVPICSFEISPNLISSPSITRPLEFSYAFITQIEIPGGPIQLKIKAAPVKYNFYKN